MLRRRVAVTGLGLVTPLGVSVGSSWSALLEGRSGVGTVRLTDCGDSVADGLPCKVGARVDQGALAAACSESGAVTNPRSQGPGFITMALCAAEEAMMDAGLNNVGSFDPARAGVAIGSGIGSSVEEVQEAYKVLTERGLRRLSPFFVPRLLVNLAAGHVAIRHNLQGPNHACSTACATGAHSIGDAARMVMLGDADVMVAGGTESTMNALSYAGFSRIKALSTKYNENPQAASRPFDKDRDGFVMGEGAGVVVLEELEHAKARGAQIYATVDGYGMSGDAFHLTAPSNEGTGAMASMRAALASADVSADKVDYVNAHATSTPLGDAIEARAISTVFGAGTPAVSSTKGNVGHLLGAAGAVESIFTILSIAHNKVPGTLNLEESDLDPEVAEKIRLVRGPHMEMEVRHAICNSFGFGGTNASLLFSKPDIN